MYKAVSAYQSQDNTNTESKNETEEIKETNESGFFRSPFAWHTNPELGILWLSGRD